MTRLVRELSGTVAVAALLALSTAAPAGADAQRLSGPTTVRDESKKLVQLDTAYDTVNNVYLMVWGTQASGPVNGQFLDFNGAPVGSVFAISAGAQQSGWARVVYSPEQQRFVVAYTKVLGSTSYQRTVRMLAYDNGAAAFLTNEIPIATFPDSGGSAGLAYSPGASMFLVTWQQWAPFAKPRSFVTPVSPSGTVGTAQLVTNINDGQSDPNIACNSTGRCLVAGYSWGGTNNNLNTVWGRFIDGAAATPAGATSLNLDGAAVEGDSNVVFSPAADKFLIYFTRDFKAIWGKLFDANGTGGSAFLMKQSTNAAVDGGGFGLARISYNTSSATMLLTMGSWAGQPCAQELTPLGVNIGAVDCVSGSGGTPFTVSTPDPVHTRFLMTDNQGNTKIRATLYAATAPGQQAPSITTQPQSQNIVTNATATLSVLATGTATLTYQWYQGTSPNTGSPINGATSSSYTTPSLASTASYWVRVSNAFNPPADSSTATITVSAPSVPPSITTQPQSTSISQGATATLSVVATGSATLTYQWYQGTSPSTTTPINGATLASYTTPALSNTTSYWVQVNNNVNPAANSNTATVTVTSSGGGGTGLQRLSGPTTVRDESKKLTQFDTAYDTVNNVYLMVWGTQASGPVNGQFLDFNGAPVGSVFAISAGAQQSGWARVVYSPEQQRFVVAYTKVLGSTSYQRTVHMLAYDNGAAAFLTNEIPVATFPDSGGSAGLAYSPGASMFLVTWQQWAPFAKPRSYVTPVSPSGTVGTAQLVTNINDGQSDPNIACNSTGRCLVAGYSWGGTNNNLNTVWGRFIDGAAATPAGATSLNLDGAAVEGDSNVVFSPAADKFLIYFTRDFKAIWGKLFDANGTGGSAFLMKQSTNAAVDGGGFGLARISYNTSSATMMLTMGSWAGQPCAQELTPLGVNIGAVDCVSGSGGTPFTVSTSDPVHTRFLMTDNQGSTKIRATLYTGSAPAQQAPSIITQPQSQNVAYNATTTVSVVANGSAPLSYQWYFGTSGDTSSPINGATVSSFTTPPLTATVSGWVRVSNAFDPPADSNTLTITVAAPLAPSITTQPQSQNIVTNATATLSVVATGTATLTYQWYQGTSPSTTTPINGATSSSYTTPSLGSTTSYWVRVSNGFGSPANSSTATITVTAPSVPPSITTQPQSTSISQGATATLSVVATGSATLTYQWYQGTSPSTTTPINGATLASYTTPALSNTTSYWVRVSNNVNPVANSNTATVTVTSSGGGGGTGLTRLSGPTTVRDESKLLVAFDTAYDTVNNVYLNVWGTQGAGPVNGQFLDFNGAPIGSVFAISTGAQQSGWARVIYSPEQQRFVVAYTKILGSSSHQRMIRMLAYSSGGASFLTNEIPIASFPDSGGSAGLAYSPSAAMFMVTWHQWAPYSKPRSYVTPVSPSGTVGAAQLVSDINDGQSDPNIACNATGRCLVVGYSWGSTNNNLNTIWGRFIDGAAATPAGATSSNLDGSAIEGDANVLFVPSTDKFLVYFNRDFKKIWGKLFDANGSGGSAFLMKQSTNEAVDGGGFGLARISYNATSATMMLSMGSWFGLACAQELSPLGVNIGAVDCVAGPQEGTHFTMSAADPVHNQFLMTDNQSYNKIRATIYAASAPAQQAPSITAQPQSQNIVTNATATLSVVATGTPTLTYQWYQGTSPSTTTPINGATSSSYTTPSLASTASYWVRVSNAFNPAADSSTATITVSAPTAPSITTHPQSKTIVQNSSTTLSVVATGTATLTYQWYQGTSPSTTNPINGATSSSYTTPALTNTTSYWVRVSNGVNPVANSNTATVTITIPSNTGLLRLSGPTTVRDESKLLVAFDTAYDTINNVYLNVWGTQGAGPVNGQFLDFNGAPIGSVFAISTGAQQSGWARVIYSPEQQRFVVAYTKILGSSSHQRMIRMLAYSSGAASFLTNEIPIASFPDSGNSAGLAYSPGASMFMVTWQQWAPFAKPRSYVTPVSPSGTVGTAQLLTDINDGQSDPDIACNSTGRCLVVGYGWGTTNNNLNTVWGRFIDGAAATPAGASSVNLDGAPVEGDAQVLYVPSTDKFLVYFNRDFKNIWGKSFDTNGTGGSAFLMKQSTNAAVDGGGFGLARISYNTTSATMMLSMGSWFGLACAQELSPTGANIGAVDCVAGPQEGTHFTMSTADPVHGRFLMTDNQAYNKIRATIYAASPPAP